MISPKSTVQSLIASKIGGLSYPEQKKQMVKDEKRRAICLISLGAGLMAYKFKQGNHGNLSIAECIFLLGVTDLVYPNIVTNVSTNVVKTVATNLDQKTRTEIANVLAENPFLLAYCIIQGTSPFMFLITLYLYVQNRRKNNGEDEGENQTEKPPTSPKDGGGNDGLTLDINQVDPRFEFNTRELLAENFWANSTEELVPKFTVPRVRYSTSRPGLNKPQFNPIRRLF